MDEIESTKTIPDLGDSLVEYVREHLKKKVAKKPKPDWQYRGGDVHEFGDSENGYVVLAENGEVEYFVRIRRISHSGFKLGRQVLLWRNRERFASDVSGGFAQYVFFNILLPRYTALIADKEQTRNGSTFWSNAIISALRQNLYVYCLDRRSRQTQLTALEDWQAVEFYRDVLWGRTQSHLLTFAVISQKPLKLPERK